MTNDLSHVTMRVIFHRGEPYVESRCRPVGDGEGGPVPKGKILVLRKPLLAPDDDDSRTESELIDDDGSAEAFCPECAAGGHDPDDVAWVPFGIPIKSDAPKVGRNDPCPCGSQKKYKRCCLH
jgi:hypothetical protein